MTIENAKTSPIPFEVIPAIDLLGGDAVRLSQGRYDEVTVYESDPAKVAL
jgi:phosphoribosylformimino-5-aminoimidazole carboxamide ribotide isomerase